MLAVTVGALACCAAGALWSFGASAPPPREGSLVSHAPSSASLELVAPVPPLDRSPIADKVEEPVKARSAVDLENDAPKAPALPPGVMEHSVAYLKRTANSFEGRIDNGHASRGVHSAIAVLLQAQGRARNYEVPYPFPPKDVGPADAAFIQNAQVFVFGIDEFPAYRRWHEHMGRSKPVDPLTNEPGSPDSTHVSDDLRDDIAALMAEALKLVDG